MTIIITKAGNIAEIHEHVERFHGSEAAGVLDFWIAGKQHTRSLVVGIVKVEVIP